MGDPHATAIVYKAPVEIMSIGLDVTLQCTMDPAECKSKFTGDVLELVASMAEVWFRRAGHVVFHDPLAAAVIFDPEICTYQTGKVDVELGSTRTQGMTHWTPGEGQMHQIAVGVDKDRFFEHYLSVAT